MSAENPWKYRLSEISFGPEEEEAVLRVVRSRWLSMGPETAALETEFANFVGSKYALAVTNCTAALHLALVGLGIGARDEVIVPSLTFVATANVVLQCGAKPVFADITSLAQPCLDPVDVERKITSKTKAVIAMHYAGYPCDMDRLRALSRSHGLRLIEDAAHCAGSAQGEQACGTLSDVGCFSFFGNKNLPAGEGGMLVTADDAVAAQLKLLRSHGMNTLSWDRSRGHASDYDVLAAGYNYRMPELTAAIARAQLLKVKSHNQSRDRIFAIYLRELGQVDSLTIPFASTVNHSPGSRHLFVTLLPPGADRTAIRAELKSHGIQTSVHYPPAHRFALYREATTARAGLPLTEDFAARVLTLPFHQGLTEEAVVEICARLRTAVA